MDEENGLKFLLNMCRMCKTTTNQLEPIFHTIYEERTVAEMLSEVCYKVEINENDGLSQQICIFCKEKLANAYQFQMMTITTDSEIKGMLTNLIQCKKEISDDFGYDEDDDRFEMVDVSSFFDAEVKIETDESKSIDTEKLSKRKSDSKQKKKHTKTHSTPEKEDDVSKKVKAIDEEDITEDYYCLMCNKDFSSAKSYQYHMKLAHNKDDKPKKATPKKTKRACHICGISVYSLNRHLKTHSSSNDPDLPTTYKISLDADSTKCLYCPMEFQTKNALSSHTRFCHKEFTCDEYICDHCDKKFPRKRLHKHMKHHRVYVNCPDCNYELNRKLLRNHRKNECKHKDFSCTRCNVTFTDRTSLNRHNSENHQENDVCPMCGKEFITKYYLKLHLKTHSEDFKFECPQCPKKFNMELKLKLHMNTHNAEAKYVCNLCGQAFRHRYPLAVHERKHTNNYAHFCDLCDQKFYRHYDLVRHRRRHTGEMPYQCTYCDRSFANHGDFYK